MTGVHVDCIAAGAPPCDVLLNPYEVHSHYHELPCRYDTERGCWPCPKTCSGSCLSQAPIASLGERLSFDSPSGSPGSGGRAVYGTCSSEAMWAAYRPWLTILPNFCWAFQQLVVTVSCAASMSASGGLDARSTPAPTPYSNQDPGTITAIAPFVTSHVFFPRDSMAERAAACVSST